MERNLLRPIVLFLACATWVFLLVSLGSFHATDWPSHTVYPYPATANLCGGVGAFVAYYIYLVVGQGAFPVMFFTGVCLALCIYNNRVSDMWLRIIGMTL